MRHLDAKKKLKISRMQMQKEKTATKENKFMCHTQKLKMSRQTQKIK